VSFVASGAMHAYAKSRTAPQEPSSHGSPSRPKGAVAIVATRRAAPRRRRRKRARLVG
jgi:hypothetical protein